MVTYPKLVKPWRGYPSSNTLMAVRLRVNQKPVQDVSVGAGLGQPLGTVALTANKPYHVGTIPKGSFILPASRHLKTAFLGGGNIKIGTEADPEAILKAADSALTTVGVTTGLVGNQMGIAATDLVLWALLSAAATEGEIDIVVPFYIQKD